MNNDPAVIALMQAASLVPEWDIWPLIHATAKLDPSLLERDIRTALLTGLDDGWLQFTTDRRVRLVAAPLTAKE